MDKVLQDEFGYARIDYHKLVSWMANGIDLLRTYYYHCLPYKSSPPTEEENRRFSQKEKFFAGLKKIPRFEVRLGKLEKRGTNSTGSPIFMQKRVDVLMAVDLTRLASKGQITHAAILSGDSDFLPAVVLAKDEGVQISLFHAAKHRPHDDLWSECDDRTKITSDVIQSILRP